MAVPVSWATFIVAILEKMAVVKLKTPPQCPLSYITHLYAKVQL